MMTLSEAIVIGFSGVMVTVMVIVAIAEVLGFLRARKEMADAYARYVSAKELAEFLESRLKADTPERRQFRDKLVEMTDESKDA